MAEGFPRKAALMVFSVIRSMNPCSIKSTIRCAVTISEDDLTGGVMQWPRSWPLEATIGNGKPVPFFNNVGVLVPFLHHIVLAEKARKRTKREPGWTNSFRFPGKAPR